MTRPLSSPIRKKERMTGEHYVLAFTKPHYDRESHRYLPDSLRFVMPTIRHVAYGGKLKPEAGTRYCAICGRKGREPFCFLDLDSMKELFISQHCLSHPAVQLFTDGTSSDAVKSWYEAEDLRQGARAGDPLAAAAMMDEPLDYIYGGE